MAWGDESLERRVQYLLVTTANGALDGREVKSGWARYTKLQRLKDAEIANQGARMVGKNAPPEVIRYD